MRRRSPRASRALARGRGRATLCRMESERPSAPSPPPPRDGWRTRGEQANHRIEQKGKALWVTVWRRPDLDTATGAALALALVDGLLATLAGPGALRAIVLDLRQAPPISGPATQSSLGRLLAACED